MKRFALGMAAALLAACGSSPRPQFYTLQSGEYSGSTAAAAFTVSVGPVSVPESVDRPQLVVRLGANEVALAEQARWAEPLTSSIPRVIANNVARDLGNARVAAQSTGMVDDADYRIRVDIERFDSRPGDAVVIEAAWLVRPAKGAGTWTGRSLLREDAPGKEYDVLVAAHSRALAALSAEIAHALRAVVEGRHGPRVQ